MSVEASVEPQQVTLGTLEVSIPSITEDSMAKNLVTTPSQTVGTWSIEPTKSDHDMPLRSNSWAMWLLR